MARRTEARFASKNKSSRFGLSLRSERLETRDLLAGDVAVTKNGTTLNITGNSLGNEVVIVGDATPGTYHVFGFDADASGDNTTINGQVYDFSGDGLTFTGIRAINANLNGGDDFLALTNVPEAIGNVNRLNGITVNTHAGNDRVSIGNIDPAALTDAGFDADVIASLEGFTGLIDQKTTLNVNTADGNDSVSIRGVTSGGAHSYLLGSGDDELLLDTVAAASINANFGTGAVSSIANAAVTTTGNLTITAANGNNSDAFLTILGIDVGGNMNVNLGTGNNAVDLESGEIDGNLIVTAPSLKNNSVDNFADVYLSGLNIDDLASIVTGTGDDSVTFAGSSADVVSIVTGNGNDGIAISSDIDAETARIATINTGSGNDDVHIGNDGETLFGAAAFDNLTVLLGAGDDCLAIGSTTVRNFANFNGGAGTDNYDDNLLNEFPTAASKNVRVLFETFDDCEEDL